ncbi:L-threonylcarbamoyladenylate synthase [Actinomarinicola tropica]|uniref:Threonylcarbamoyl-AMP synthase n=1 Tax=Actinomarinicola tropica TaxID=2789776 RepID=A0A5Q2RGY2_9ACTN|nr:L-threonylcarbamoyladenylate synthase [Actinomarinicola tropica]QGG96089.1 threonylcarbamoyl-AMP synthase [Actinomarinicola tropica]
MTKIGTDVHAAASILRSGGLVGLPTETVYGLAALVSLPEAVARVFRAKGRPTDHPLIVHVAGVDDLDRFARDVPPAARVLAARHWPGPLTILLRRSDAVADVVTGGRDTVALRAPAHPLAHALLAELGDGVVAPSANRFGRVSPTSAADVVAELGDAVDLVLDGGPCTVGIESTIVDLSGGVPRLLRAGQVTLAELREDLPDAEAAGDAAEPVAPGMLAAHYAPDARVVVLDPAVAPGEVARVVAPHVRDGRSVAVLAPDLIPGLLPPVEQLDAAGGPAAYARVLYARLREADRRGVDVLVVVPPPGDGIGAAVRDRLRRAAAGSAGTG